MVHFEKKEVAVRYNGVKTSTPRLILFTSYITFLSLPFVVTRGHITTMQKNDKNVRHSSG